MSEQGYDSRRFDQPTTFPNQTRPSSETNNSQTADGSSLENEGIGGLVSGLLTDLQGIVRDEIALARVEIKEDVSTAGRAMGMLGAGALMALTGFIFLMLGVTYLLNKSLEMWLSAGIVGAALAVIAAIMLSQARSKLSATSLKPDQTIDSLKEDQTWAKQQMNSVKR